MNIEKYSSKKYKTTLLLAIFGGCFGAHRFYAGKMATGILYVFTAGGFGFGCLADIITICKREFTDGDGKIIYPGYESGVSNKKWNVFKSITVACAVMTIIGLIVVATENSEMSESLPPTILFAVLMLVFARLAINSSKNKEDAGTILDLDTYDDYETIDPDDISAIDYMDGHSFEYYCADILRKNGFIEVSVTKGSGDQGVDILATKDGIKYAIQCKNYASSLSNTPVQEVNAGKTFYNCHVGVVMTNSTFTQGAKELAKATGVLLWDREIVQKMIENAR